MSAAVKALPGVASLDYDAQQDVFTMEYEPERVRLEDIFTAVVLRGKRMGQEYRPRVIN